MSTEPELPGRLVAITVAIESDSESDDDDGSSAVPREKAAVGDPTPVRDLMEQFQFNAKIFAQFHEMSSNFSNYRSVRGDGTRAWETAQRRDL